MLHRDKPSTERRVTPNLTASQAGRLRGDEHPEHLNNYRGVSALHQRGRGCFVTVNFGGIFSFVSPEFQRPSTNRDITLISSLHFHFSVNRFDWNFSKTCTSLKETNGSSFNENDRRIFELCRFKASAEITRGSSELCTVFARTSKRHIFNDLVMS